MSLNRKLLLIALLLSSIVSTAQFRLGKTKSKITSIRASAGGFTDNYNDIDAEGMLSLIGTGEQYDFNLADYGSEDLSYASLTGGVLGLDITFNPYKADGTLTPSPAIRLGVAANV